MACALLGIWGSGAAPAWSHCLGMFPFCGSQLGPRPNQLCFQEALSFSVAPWEGAPGWEAEITLHPEALFSVIGALLVCLPVPCSLCSPLSGPVLWLPGVTRTATVSTWGQGALGAGFAEGKGPWLSLLGPQHHSCTRAQARPAWLMGDSLCRSGTRRVGVVGDQTSEQG